MRSVPRAVRAGQNSLGRQLASRCHLQLPGTWGATQRRELPRSELHGVCGMAGCLVTVKPYQGLSSSSSPVYCKHCCCSILLASQVPSLPMSACAKIGGAQQDSTRINRSSITSPAYEGMVTLAIAMRSLWQLF